MGKHRKTFSRESGSEGSYEIRRNGRYDSNGGPSIVKYKNGSLLFEMWHKNGKYHREDGPAIVKYYCNKADGSFFNNEKNRNKECMERYERQLSAEYWYYDGKDHRTDGPAIRCYDQYGQVTTEHWLQNGKYYSSDPNQATYISHSIDYSDEWSRHSYKKEWRVGIRDGGDYDLHRIDGPAVIEHDWAYRREWWVNGERHRLIGPAVIVEDYDDVQYQYFFNDRDVTQLFEKWLKNNNVDEDWRTWDSETKVYILMIWKNNEMELLNE